MCPRCSHCPGTSSPCWFVHKDWGARWNSLSHELGVRSCFPEEWCVLTPTDPLGRPSCAEMAAGRPRWQQGAPGIFADSGGDCEADKMIDTLRA